MSRTPADRRSSTCEVGRTGQDTRQPIRCQPTDKVSADKAAGAGDQNGLATRSLGRLSFTLISRHRGGLVFQAATPKRAPTAAVNAIARAPQKATRMTDATTGAPPARAATRPNSARNRSELPARPHISADAGSRRTIRRGKAAPTANVPAEANAPARVAQPRYRIYRVHHDHAPQVRHAASTGWKPAMPVIRPDRV